MDGGDAADVDQIGDRQGGLEVSIHPILGA
jgi:hypothetical protein